VPVSDRVEWTGGTYRGKPALKLRGATALIRSPEILLWAARNKLNATFYTDLRRFPMAKMLGFADFEGGHLSTQMLNPDDAYPYRGEDNPYPFVIDPETGQRGGEGRGGTGALTYYEAHPEWFGYSREFGDRDVWRPDDPRGATIMRNFCISNAGARAEWVKNASAFIESKPYLDVVFVDLNDTPKFCECAVCLENNPADWNLLLMRQLAAAVRDAGLDTKVGVNFYTYTRTDLPPTEPIELTEAEYASLQPSYAPIRRCFAHGVVDRHCHEPQSPAESNRYNAEFFDSWRAAGFTGQYMVVDYINRGPWMWLPAMVSKRFAEDFLTYSVELDAIESWMAFGVQPPFGAKTFDYYLFAKLCDKGAEAAHRHDELFAQYCRNVAGSEHAAEFQALMELTAQTFVNISYFCNRPHSIFEGILAQYRPQMVRGAAIEPERNPWRLPYGGIEDAFPFEHLAYTAQPDEGANSLDIEEMRPLLEQLHGAIESFDRAELSDNARDRWEGVRPQLRYGYHFAHVLIGLADAFRFELEDDAAARGETLLALSEHLTVLEDAALAEYWNWAKQGPWRMALHHLLENSPEERGILAAEHPFLAEMPRGPQGGPPPQRPRPGGN
jgi:hypothetical protein